jgi:AcrR family transcriptional regulator
MIQLSQGAPMVAAVQAVHSRRADFEANRERILEAAREIAAERGPEGLTVAEVARRAGVNRTTAYQHYRTRDELVEAVMESLGSEVADMLTERAELGERIDRLAEYFVSHPEISRLTLHQLLAQNPFPEDAYNTYLAEIHGVVEAGGARADTDTEMLGLILMSLGVLWPTVARTQTDDEELIRAGTRRLAREVKRLLLYGFLLPEKWPDLVREVSPKGPRRAK